MKSEKSFRGSPNGSYDSEYLNRKAVKLDPIRKSGKERHSLYEELDEETEAFEFDTFRKKESILDYFDDDEEE